MSKIFKNVRKIVNRGSEVGGTIIGILGGAATIHYLNEIRKNRIRNKLIIDPEILEQAKEFTNKMNSIGIENVDQQEVAKDLQIKKQEAQQYNYNHKQRQTND